MNYSQKLRDPRWQKLRLKVFERDSFTCQDCSSTTETLEVHHEKYTARDPWDEPIENLKTVCTFCHTRKHGAGYSLSYMLQQLDISVKNGNGMAAAMIDREIEIAYSQKQHATT